MRCSGFWAAQDRASAVWCKEVRRRTLDVKTRLRQTPNAERPTRRLVVARRDGLRRAAFTGQRGEVDVAEAALVAGEHHPLDHPEGDAPVGLHIDQPAEGVVRVVGV